jgi:hypothetical protein
MSGKEVHMQQDHEKEIKKIAGDLECAKQFKCYKQGLKNLCKAKDVGLETHLECLEEEPFECPLSVHFGGLYYCRCPLRVYIAKELKK